MDVGSGRHRMATDSVQFNLFCSSQRKSQWKASVKRGVLSFARNGRRTVICATPRVRGWSYGRHAEKITAETHSEIQHFVHFCHISTYLFIYSVATAWILCCSFTATYVTRRMNGGCPELDWTWSQMNLWFCCQASFRGRLMSCCDSWSSW